MPVGVILSVGGSRHAVAAPVATGAHEKDVGILVSSVQARRSIFEPQQHGAPLSSGSAQKPAGVVAAATGIATVACSEPPVRALRATPRRVGGGGGGGGGYGGSRSWYFGTDVSNAPEGTIAIRLPMSSSPFAANSAATADSAPAAHGAARLTAVQPVMTPERRAQATVWDHVRFEGRGEIGPDPSLVAEARRLMMLDAWDVGAAGETDLSEDGKRKKKLCFSSDPETFEYQSEQSRIEELGITPDYPMGSFEVADPTVRAAARKIDAAPHAFKRDLSPLPAANSEIANYRAKLSSESFVWGIRGDRPDSGQTLTPESASGARTTNSKLPVSQDGPDNEQSRREEPERLHHHQEQQQQQQQWSVSTTADLLF